MKFLKEATLLGGTFLPSWLRLATWRLLGFKVGRGSHVSMFSVVVADQIEIGPGAVIEVMTLIYRPTLLHLGERSRIAGFVRIIGHEGAVRLKPQSFVGLGCLIDSTAGFELGNRSQLGPRVTAFSHGGSQLLFNMRYPHRYEPIIIGSDCWIGMGCIVHPGAAVGDRSIVFPGLVVRGRIDQDTSLVALQPEHRVISTQRLLLGVSVEDQQRKIEGLFKLLAEQRCGSSLDCGEEENWCLKLGRAKTIHLLRRSGVDIPPNASNTETLIWTRSQEDVVVGKTCFCFERLIVFGPWTPFAEEVAAFLCRTGAQFVFADASPLAGGSTGT